MINNYVDSLKVPYDYNNDSKMQSNGRQWPAAQLSEDEQKTQTLLRKI